MNSPEIKQRIYTFAADYSVSALYLFSCSVTMLLFGAGYYVHRLVVIQVGVTDRRLQEVLKKTEQQKLLTQECQQLIRSLAMLKKRHSHYKKRMAGMSDQIGYILGLSEQVGLNISTFAADGGVIKKGFLKQKPPLQVAGTLEQFKDFLSAIAKSERMISCTDCSVTMDEDGSMQARILLSFITAPLEENNQKV